MPTVDEKRALAVGSFYQALLTGVLSQWLIDPEHAPSGQDLALALREIVSHYGQPALVTKAPNRPARQAVEIGVTVGATLRGLASVFYTRQWSGGTG